MKIKLISMALISVFSNAAYAAPPVAELKVAGTLTVPSCIVTAPADGIYDYGPLPSTLIKPSASTALTSMAKNWVVTCDANTYLTYEVTDNRAASAVIVSEGAFGLGNVNTAGKVGHYIVNMQNVTVDTIPRKVVAVESATYTAFDAYGVLKNHKMSWASGDNVLQAGKIFTMDLEVAPILASTTTMNGPIKEEVPLDGSLTLNFAFGI